MKYKINKSGIVGALVSMIEQEIDSYSESDESIDLNDKEGKCLISYRINHKELYYDHSLRDYVLSFIDFVDLETFRESVKNFFNIHFPDIIVKRVFSANIVKF